MKIKILTPIAGVTFSFSPGDTADFEDADAKRLIAAGYAEEVKSATKKATQTKAK